MSTVNMFELASRQRLRFTAPNGSIGTEDLWDVPMTTLDTIAKTLRRELRDNEESFVKPTAKNTKAELAFEIVKYVIEVRMAEDARKKTLKENTAKRQHLLEILERKQNASLETMSAEDLQKMIADLSVETNS